MNSQTFYSYQPSLFISSIDRNIKGTQIEEYFNNSGFGSVANVIIKSGKHTKYAIIHFKWWNLHQTERERSILIRGEHIRMYYSGPLYWKVVSYREPIPRKPVSRSVKPNFQIYNDEINQFINDISQKCSIGAKEVGEIPVTINAGTSVKEFAPSTPTITNVDNLIVNAPIKLTIPDHEKENINFEGCCKNLNSDCFSDLSEDDNSLDDLDNITQVLDWNIDFGPPILHNCKGKPFQRRTILIK